MRGALRGLVNAALPSLRVVALVYAGLSGIAVLVVVITAAVTPRAPAVQQVTEPARETVTTLVQPTTDMLTGIIAAPAPAPPTAAPRLAAAPTALPFVDMTTLDVVIDAPPAPAPQAVVVPRVVYVAAPAPAPAPALDSGDDQSADDLGATDGASAEAPSNDQVVIAPQDAPALQEAVAEAPKALPTPTVFIPTTAEQVRAQVDAANQAAIDAAKTATATAKAQADAANQAAINAALTAATPNPKQTADAAKLQAAQQKAEADAANQAAIDAAKAAAKKH